MCRAARAAGGQRNGHPRFEFAPSDWARYRPAFDAAAGLVEYGFTTLHLRMIVGDTASGNTRVEKIARWLGARIIDGRDSLEWMRAHGWQEEGRAIYR